MAASLGDSRVKALATTSTTISSCKVSPCWRGGVCNKMCDKATQDAPRPADGKPGIPLQGKAEGFPVLPYCVACPKRDPYLIQVVCQEQPLAPVLRLYRLEATKLVFYGIVPSGRALQVEQCHGCAGGPLESPETFKLA